MKGTRRLFSRIGTGFLLTALFLIPVTARADDALSFESFTLPVNGIVRNFLTADFNGDNLRDVVVTHIVLNEAERRVDRYFSLFLQNETGFPNEPTQTWEAPKDAVGVDAGNLDLSTPGPELGYISSAGVFYFRFDKDRFITGPTRLITASTLFRSPDPYGVIRVEFINDFDRDGRDEIALFDFDQTYYYTPYEGKNGKADWQLSQIFPTPLHSRTSNYWENDMIFSRIEQNSSRIESLLPQFLLGDFDGDGLSDVFVPENDRVLIYKQLPGKRFSEKATLVDFGIFRLDQLMRHGHIPDVTRLLSGDFNGDGLADIVISRLRVADLSDAELTSNFYIFINQGGKFGERPDEIFTWDSFVEQPLIADYNGDGRDDIAVQRFPFNWWQLIKLSMFECVTVTYEVYYSRETGLHKKSPDEDRNLNFSFDLSEQSASLLTGFSVFADYNGDRRLDLLQASDMDEYEIRLSSADEWADDDADVDAPSSFFTFPEDMNGDGRDDILIRYAGRGDLDSTVRVLLVRQPPASK